MSNDVIPSKKLVQLCFNQQGDAGNSGLKGKPGKPGGKVSFKALKIC